MRDYLTIFNCDFVDDKNDKKSNENLQWNNCFEKF